MDDVLKHLHLKGLTDICRSYASYTPLNGRSRKDIYTFIASVGNDTQEDIINRVQQVLANPTSQSCKKSWMLKRKLEDAEEEIRNVRAKLERMNSNLGSLGGHGERDHNKVDLLLTTSIVQKP